MKHLMLALCTVFFISCTPKSEQEKLTGDWKRKDPVEVDGKKTVDQITFAKNGDITVKIKLDGQDSEMKGKYMFDAASKKLTVIYPESGQHEFDVKKLTDNEMEVFNVKMNHTAVYEKE